MSVLQVGATLRDYSLIYLFMCVGRWQGVFYWFGTPTLFWEATSAPWLCVVFCDAEEARLTGAVYGNTPPVRAYNTSHWFYWRSYGISSDKIIVTCYSD
jgi:hypothetical protein